MTRTEVVGIAAIVVICTGAGWYLGRVWPEFPAPTGAAGPEGALPALVAAQPDIRADSVLVNDDGTVSVRASRAPLSWLYEELARQGAVRGPVSGAGGAPTEPTLVGNPAPANLATSHPRLPVDARQIQRALREGTEAERLSALADAESLDIPVPDALMLQVLDADPSERVRLTAFAAYVEAKADNPNAARAAIEAALYNSSPAVQAEARRRWEESDRAQAMRPANDPQSPP